MSVCLVAPAVGINVVEGRLVDGQVLAPELAWAATALLGLGWLVPVLLVWWMVKGIWPRLTSGRARLGWLAGSLAGQLFVMSTASGWVATVGDPFREHLVEKQRSPDRERMAYLFEEVPVCGFAVYERPMDSLLADRVLHRATSCDVAAPKLVYEAGSPGLSCEELEGQHRDFCRYGELLALAPSELDRALELARGIDEQVIRGTAVFSWVREHAAELPPEASELCRMLPGSQGAQCVRRLEAVHLQR